MMSMHRFALNALAAAALLGSAAAAQAVAAVPAPVTYTFTAFSSFDFDGEMVSGAFTVTLPGFITENTIVPLGNLGSCTVVSSLGDPAACREQQFLFDILPNYEVISFGIQTPSNPGTGVFYYFNSGALSTLGTHESQLFGTEQAGRLVVSQVPEPATWLSMALGLGVLAGAAVRRKPA